MQLPYDFSSAVELLALCNKHGLRVSELMMANERAWRSDEQIRSETGADKEIGRAHV